MGAAALNDAVAWCLLILAISMANATDMNSAAWAFLTTFGFAVILFFIVNPIFAYMVARLEEAKTKKMHDNLFVFTLMMVFICAWVTGRNLDLFVSPQLLMNVFVYECQLRACRSTPHLRCLSIRVDCASK